MREGASTRSDLLRAKLLTAAWMRWRWVCRVAQPASNSNQTDQFPEEGAASLDPSLRAGGNDFAPFHSAVSNEGFQHDHV